MEKSSTTKYVEMVYATLKEMKPDDTITVASSSNPEMLIAAVKFIIDLRIINVEFNADYTIIKRLEDIKCKK